jgi:capsular polysaccharide transport system ATP-binding protein
MISLHNVSKSYHLKGVKKQILDKVDFEFPTDKNLAIMGRNGAGKSTTMRLLAGIELPDTGKVYRSSRVSWPLGFSGGFNGSMTGIENIRFVARLYGHDTKEVIEYVRQFSELGKSLKLPIKTYSSGMKARLAFGLSMAIDFDCYLIDEITAVGDQNFRAKSKQVFDSKLASSQIIMISHSMHSIREYCDAGIFLEGGKIYYYDDINEIIKDYEALLTA